MPKGIGYGKKARSILGRAMSEVFSSDKKRPRKQKIAIAFSKARKRGAKLPKR